MHSLSNKENVYYVYMYLRDIDSSTGVKGSPYYVGKGKGNRAYRKDKLPRLPKVPKDKNNIQFVAMNLSEIDALQTEVLYIYLHGRADLGKGCLRNFTNGGEGVSGFRPSEEQNQRNRERSLGKKKGPYPEEHRKNISKGLTGRKRPPFSEEHIKKMTEHCKNNGIEWSRRLCEARRMKKLNSTKTN